MGIRRDLLRGLRKRGEGVTHTLQEANPFSSRLRGWIRYCPGRSPRSQDDGAGKAPIYDFPNGAKSVCPLLSQKDME